MRTYNSFNELAVGNGAPPQSVMSIFNNTACTTNLNVQGFRRMSGVERKAIKERQAAQQAEQQRQKQEAFQPPQQKQPTPQEVAARKQKQLEFAQQMSQQDMADLTETPQHLQDTIGKIQAIKPEDPQATTKLDAFAKELRELHFSNNQCISGITHSTFPFITSSCVGGL